MAAKPTGWNRFIANLQGEVPAAELEAFRHASGPVFELLEQLEQRRLACRIDGLDPWTVPPATRAAFLCAWNAFVLQTLGNEFLDADYRAEPRTPHFVPPVTARQVLDFYEPVEGWVNRGLQAQANPEYRLEVDVPAALPVFQRVEPLPPAHLDGLLHAVRSVRNHAAAAMEFLPATPPAERERQLHLNHIRQLYASAQARARYAEDLCGTDPVPEVRERAGEHARSAIAQFYLLGQLVSDPWLSAGPAPALAPPRGQTPARAEPPPVPAPRPARAAGLHLLTRRDHSTDLTITETEETIDFRGQLSGEVSFSLGLAQVRTPEGQSIALRVKAWSYDAYPLITTGTLTIGTDGQDSVLRPLPDRKRRPSHVREEISYEEDLAYALPDGLLQKLCTARHAVLRFKNYRGTMDVDTATMERFQAYCRTFYGAVVKPAESPAGRRLAPDVAAADGGSVARETAGGLGDDPSPNPLTSSAGSLRVATQAGHVASRRTTSAARRETGQRELRCPGAKTDVPFGRLRRHRPRGCSSTSAATPPCEPPSCCWPCFFAAHPSLPRRPPSPPRRWTRGSFRLPWSALPRLRTRRAATTLPARCAAPRWARSSAGWASRR